MPGKRVQIDDETWQALDLLARDQMKTFQELADEAFGDLLKKNNRPGELERGPAKERWPQRVGASAASREEETRKTLGRVRTSGIGPSVCPVWD